MTREEAIEELSVIWERLSHPEECENGCYSFRDGDYLEALDMAIEALSADVEIPSDKTVVHIETYRRLYEKYVDLKNNAVKVVKCKNCRHRFYDKYNDCYMCNRHEYGESFEDDDYCSWGERREP